MAVRLRTFRIGDAPKRGEGLRLAATRFLPRGVKKAVLLVAEFSKRTAVSVGCYCADEAQCHRTVLARIIRTAMEGRWPG